MKVFIYPAYDNSSGNWAVLLRNKQGASKHIKGNEAGKDKIYLYLTALKKGLEAIKYSVNLEIYTHLKRMEIAIGEKRLHKWAQDNWAHSPLEHIDL